MSKSSTFRISSLIADIKRSEDSSDLSSRFIENGLNLNKLMQNSFELSNRIEEKLNWKNRTDVLEKLIHASSKSASYLNVANKCKIFEALGNRSMEGEDPNKIQHISSDFCNCFACQTLRIINWNKSQCSGITDSGHSSFSMSTLPVEFTSTFYQQYLQQQQQQQSEYFSNQNYNFDIEEDKSKKYESNKSYYNNEIKTDQINSKPLSYDKVDINRGFFINLT
jgi:hypothetical protein